LTRERVSSSRQIRDRIVGRPTFFTVDQEGPRVLESIGGLTEDCRHGDDQHRLNDTLITFERVLDGWIRRREESVTIARFCA
jgi:hypothetical protein